MLTFTMVFFTIISMHAQQNATRQTTPVMKADSKPSVINAPTINNAAPKACCAGKTEGQCSHDSKTCSNAGEAKACCQKPGSTQTCNHGAAEKAAPKKQ